MIILAKRENEGYDIFKASFVSYDENLYDSSISPIEGLYIELIESDSCFIANLTKKDCNSLIKDLYRYGKLDLTKYTLKYFDKDDEE